MRAISRWGLRVLASVVLAVVPPAAASPPIEVAPESTLAGLLSDGAPSVLQDGDAEALAAEILTAMGAAYHGGHHRAADPAKARQLLRAAAEKGDPRAMRVYGHLLLHGTGGPKDPARALMWFERAAASDDPLAAYWAGRIRESGTAEVERDPTAAAAHYRRAWAAGLVQAATRLGGLFVAGDGVERDAEKAVALFEAAAALGYPEAQAALARQYYLGEGTLQDYARAYQLYDLAARVGDPQGLSMAAYMVARGQAQARNPSRPLNYLLIAAARGNVLAQYNLGVLFATGQDVKPSPVLAHALFNVASAGGHEASLAARDQIGARLSGEDVAQAQRLARAFPDKFDMFELKPASHGTGFFVSIGGTIVTNHHVVDGCAAVHVHDPEAGFVPAKVILARPSPVDVAVLRLAPEPGTRIDRSVGLFAPADRLQLGEEITIFGFPKYGMLSRKGVLSTGILNATEGLNSNADTMQVSAPIQPGNSGGAILDERGDIIGVVHSALRPQIDESRTFIPQNVNFGTKARVVKDMLRGVGQSFYQRDRDATAPVPQKTRARVAQRITRQLVCMVHALQR